MSDRTNGLKLLVGISNPSTMPRLVDLAVRLNLSAGCELVFTHVVEVPRQIGLAAARSSPDVVAGRRLLQEALDRAGEAGVVGEAVVEVGRAAHEGLVAAARSRGADLVMVGYSEPPKEADEAGEKRFDRFTHRVARDLAADLIVGKFRGEGADRILVPVEPASDLTAVGLLVGAFMQDRPRTVRFLHVSAEGDRAVESDQVRARLSDAGLAQFGELESVSGDAAEMVLTRAENCDMILLASTPSGSLRGAVTEAIADGAACSTLLRTPGRR